MRYLRLNHKKRGSAIIAGAVVFLAIMSILVIVVSMSLTGYLQGVGNNSLIGLNNTGQNQVDCSGVTKLNSEYYQHVKDAAGIYLKGDEAALIALIQIESGWDVNNKNPDSSAAGLGQFITSTARGFKEFVGGDDRRGTTWPPGNVYDDPTNHSDDARFDAKRSIYAAAHLLSGHIQRWGSLGEAYEKGYHGGNTPSQIAEAKAGRKRLENTYQILKKNGCKETTGTASGTGSNNVPLYKQCDSKWGTQPYGCGTDICDAGCGVSAAAMVLKYYGKDVDPSILASISLSNGYRQCNAGTAHSFFPFIASRYNLKNENNIKWNRAMELLKSGKPIIISGQGSAPFTYGSHFIVLTQYNRNGTISVNDSVGKLGGSRDNRSYSEEHLRKYQHFITAIYP